MRQHYFIFVRQIMNSRAVELVVEAVMTDRTFLYLKLVRNVINFIPHEGIVLEIRVIFSQAFNQFTEVHVVKGRVLKRFELVGDLLFGDKVQREDEWLGFVL